MKRIAIVIDGLTGGGAEKVMLSLAKGLIDLGNQVHLLSLSSRCDYPLPEGLIYDYLFGEKISKIDRFWRIKKSVKELEGWFEKTNARYGKFDLIISNLDKSNNLLSKSKIKNVFFVIHNSVEQELNRQKKLGPLAYYYLKQSKRNLSNKNIICVSKGIENEIKNGALISPKTSQTIYNPFDISAIKQQSIIENNEIPNEPYVIHVGRLARQKRHDVLFQSFREIDVKYKLVLLCNKPKKALKQAKKYGIEHRVIVPGFQSNPYNWIKKAEALVLSSDYEGLPTVLIESLAVGTKVVSTQCPHGPEEILLGALRQFLVPTGDFEQLASSLAKALESEIDLSNPENVSILDRIAVTTISEAYLKLAR